jgi:transcriptional antiterminator/mannitol/fructose-specific phosphotransferase system IIA component (Ntr-type)
LIFLNSRSQSLLVLLLAAECPISTKELAYKLGITPRMVRYSLEKVEQWLALQNVSVIKRPGSGIVIDAPPQIQKNLLNQIHQAETVSVAFSKNERLRLLLLILLTRTEVITAKELQQRLDVSRTTVLKDLDRAGQWLSNFDLDLIRCQNVGCQIEGDESQIRRAFIYTLLESVEEAQLLDILYNRINTSKLMPVEHFGFIRKLVGFLVDLDLSYYNRLITDLCDDFGLKLLDRSHAALVLDIAFQVNRIKKGKTVRSEFKGVLDQSNPKHKKLTTALAVKIKSIKGLALSDPELGYLVGSLENASERRHAMVFEEDWILDSNERQKLLEEIPLEVLNSVDEFISAISLYLHPALQVDMELIRSLSNHINHIREQKYLREQTPNPLYESVIKQYNYVSQLVSKHAHFFNSLLQQDLMEEEIGYITMYVAASMERLFIPSSKKKVLIVGDIPRATTSLLTSRLRFEFQNLEIAGIQSYMDYHKDPFKYEHELVITTTTINANSAPTVLVNPLLPPEDVSRLAKHMRPDRDLAYPTSEVVTSIYPAKQVRFKNLLDSKTIQCKVEANSWEEVIDVATQQLYRMHKIENRYIISIKEIIRKSGPYMVIWPGVVLLHALPEDGVRELCMSLTTLRKPVYFGHETHDPVEIAIVLGTIDKTSHLPALFDLNELIQNVNARENLTSTFHKSRILKVIANFNYSHNH